MAISSKSASVRWIVEIFPWTWPYPTPGINGQNTGTLDVEDEGGQTLLLASQETAEQINLEILAKKTDPGPQNPILDTRNMVTGLKGISLNRNKYFPDAKCNINLVGPVSPTITMGNWILITSISNDTKIKKLIRFIGQIVDLVPNYSVDPNNSVIGQQTTIVCHEWSHSLQIPINYDITTMSAILQASGTTTAQVLAAADKLTEADKGILDVDKNVDIISASYKPYQFAHLFLKLAGAINTKDVIPVIENALGGPGPTKLSEIGLAMPSVPMSLLKRLDIKATPRTAYSSGFVKVITGTQINAIPNMPPAWNGVFGDLGVPSIDSYSNDNFNDDPVGRPVSQGISALASLGEPVWGALTKYCDPSNNEVFTDIYYEINNDGDYVAKPVLVVRDKPFLLKYQAEQEYYSQRLGDAEWSLYDDIVRITIDSAYITDLRFTQTSQNSPNLIRVINADNLTSPEFQELKSKQYYTKRSDEMRRFGGSEHAAQTNFFSFDVGGKQKNVLSLDQWYRSLTAVSEAWTAETYKMASGSMRIKDNNFAISVGHNIRFGLGGVVYVAHVEQLGFAYSVDDAGIDTTITEITFSHMVQEDLQSGDLRFLDPGQITDIFGKLK